MSNQTIDIPSIRSSFDRFSQGLNGQSAGRAEAFADFESRGFPGRKHEDWKYTNLDKVLRLGFMPVADIKPGTVNREAFDSLKISDGPAVRLVFVDGQLDRSLSEIPTVKGLTISTLKESGNPDGRTSLLNDSLADLNTAFALDGAVIDVADKAVIDIPVELYNISTCPGTKMIQPRHRISAGKDARLTVIESFLSLCVGLSFTNSASTIEAGRGSRIDYFKLQHPRRTNTYIVDHTVAEVSESAAFNLYTLTLSGALVRNNLYVHMAGRHGAANLYGLYVLDGDEHADNRTLVDHAVPDCFSNELYKGILDGKSTGVFNGKIIVRQDAQKTNAYQNNRNILVSDEATVNSRPQLEIYADDVKCSHGATSAQIEDSELFYLRTRGIGKENARKLLMYAFAGEIWEHISEAPVRRFIEREVGHALGMETD